jgi:hypothetical protein
MRADHRDVQGWGGEQVVGEGRTISMTPNGRPAGTATAATPNRFVLLVNRPSRTFVRCRAHTGGRRSPDHSLCHLVRANTNRTDRQITMLRGKAARIDAALEAGLAPTDRGPRTAAPSPRHRHRPPPPRPARRPCRDPRRRSGARRDAPELGGRYVMA